MRQLVTSLVVVLFLGTSAHADQQSGTGAGMMSGQQGQMMVAGQSSSSQQAQGENAGTSIFMTNCARCHPGGGNTIVPNLPLKGSHKLASFKTFLAFIRNPKMPDGSQGAMPPFGKSSITDKQARELYDYVVSSGGSGIMGGYGMGSGMMGGYGMGRGMMGGYGMGSGMMGGYDMGPGMMGGYHGYSPECQKFYDETRDLRKQLHDKQFEYFEVLRNPKTTGETAAQLDKEMKELREKIYAKAPLGCMW